MSRRTRQGKVVPPASIKSVKLGLLDTAKTNLKMYATEVNEDRAIPAMGDGLKPSGRRTAVVMNEVAKNRQVKAARIVGDTIGKYHPHGDTGAYGALVTMVNSLVPLVQGVGNWGSNIDSPAAYRYTEALLTQYGRSMFHPMYYNPRVTKMVPSFDGSRKEPIELPSLLPNFLFNGAISIGVGISGQIPSFEPPGVLEIMIALLRKEPMDLKTAARKLRIGFQWGGHMIRNKENLRSFEEFLKTGNGSVRIGSDYEVIREEKRIRVKRLCARIRPETFLAAVRAMPDVQHADQTGAALEYQIEFHASTPFADFDKQVEKVERMMQTTYSMNLIATRRQPEPSVPEGYTVKFFAASFPQIVSTWLKWRIALEKRSLAYQLMVVEKQIQQLDWLLAAIDKLDAVVAALKAKDPAAHLMKALRIGEEGANFILDKKVRSLAVLEKASLLDKRKNLSGKRKSIQAAQKNPHETVAVYLEKATKSFKSEQNSRGMTFWGLSTPVEPAFLDPEKEEQTT